MTDQAPLSEPQDIRDPSIAQQTVWRPEMAATPDPIVPGASAPAPASNDATTVVPTPTFAPLPQWSAAPSVPPTVPSWTASQSDPAHAAWARPSAPYAPSPLSAPPASPQFA